MSNIKLIELANTWQGEGPDSGRQMLIARFKKCNLKCPFCDTQIKMATSVEGEYSIETINDALQKTKGLMITGGEPTFAENYSQMLKMLWDCDYQIANVETNGYNLQKIVTEEELGFITDRPERIVHFIYSPKVFNNKMYKNELEKIQLVSSQKYIFFKFVIDGTELTERIIRETTRINIKNKGKIYLMPQGITREEIDQNWKRTIDLADELNVNLSSRMHIMNSFT